MHLTSIVRYLPIKAAAPALQDNTADIERLKRAVALVEDRPLRVPLSCVSRLSEAFRKADFVGTVLLNDLEYHLEIVDFFPGWPEVLPAMALDLGTTHLEASLVDLTSGRRLATANMENYQVPFGADILSRIHFAGRPGGLERLHEAVLANINELAAELTAQVGLAVGDIRALSVSGNPTMVHLLLKLPPGNICREPYIPMLNYPDPFRAGELDLHIDPYAKVLVMPGVGSYFGGDLISGILASGLDQREETSMLIDVGTNAEVVLGNREWLIACAGAAGPALEGGVARMGMRAGPGAIEKVRIDPENAEISWSTIGGARPKGICGSGIIDLVAALYLARFIDIRGKFREEMLGDHLLCGDNGLYFELVPASESADGQAVVLEQVDLDAMMRSKAAMYAILTTLVNQVGVGFSELRRIFVAGAFGRHIDPRQAITLGMLPDLPLETFEPVGNSSLKGAELVLQDQDARRRCRTIVNNITYIELNVNQEFMMRFSGSKFIPHTDTSLFPSVPVFS